MLSSFANPFMMAEVIVKCEPVDEDEQDAEIKNHRIETVNDKQEKTQQEESQQEETESTTKTHLETAVLKKYENENVKEMTIGIVKFTKSSPIKRSKRILERKSISDQDEELPKVRRPIFKRKGKTEVQPDLKESNRIQSSEKIDEVEDDDCMIITEDDDCMVKTEDNDCMTNTEDDDCMIITEERNRNGRPKKKYRRKILDEADLYMEDESKLKIDGSYDSDDDENHMRNDKSCGICGKTFQKRNSVLRHLQQVHYYHDAVERVCDICRQEFYSLNEYRSHRLKHFRSTFLCDKCGKTFNQKAHLAVHTKTIHEDPSIFCTYEGCDRIFSNTTNRKKHINSVHLKLKKYICDKCPKAFSTLNALKAHTYAIHLDINMKNRFFCSVCPKSFFSKPHLNAHETIHSGEKPYPCTYPGCTWAFRNSSNRQKHMKTHLDIKPYKCELCEEQFSRKLYLETHMYKHTGKKLYTCNICFKSFSQNGNLTTHMKTLHSTNKVMYKCSQCDRTFSVKSNYTKHMLNHDDPMFTLTRPRKRRSNPNLAANLAASDVALVTKTEIVDVEYDDCYVDERPYKVRETGSVKEERSKPKSMLKNTVIVSSDPSAENKTIQIIINCAIPADDKKDEDENDTPEPEPIMVDGNKHEVATESDSDPHKTTKSENIETEEVPIDFSNIEVTRAGSLPNIIQKNYAEISTRGGNIVGNTVTMVEAQTGEGENVQVLFSEVMP